MSAYMTDCTFCLLLSYVWSRDLQQSHVSLSDGSCENPCVIRCVSFLPPEPRWKNRAGASPGQDVPTNATCTEAADGRQQARSVSKKHTFVVSPSEDLELFVTAAWPDWPLAAAGSALQNLQCFQGKPNLPVECCHRRDKAFSIWNTKSENSVITVRNTTDSKRNSLRQERQGTGEAHNCTHGPEGFRT